MSKFAQVAGIVLLFVAGGLSWTLWEAQFSGFRLISLDADTRIMIPVLAVIGVAAIVLGRRSEREERELTKGLGLNERPSDKHLDRP